LGWLRRWWRWRFRSRYDRATLLSLARDRSERWSSAPPLAKPASLSREDQYLSEGHLHVAERNRQWNAGHVAQSWSENLILEKYYAPVLDTPSYESKTGHRWPDAQRADGQRRFQAMQPPPAPYVSLADVAEGKHFIRLWPPTAFWTLVAVAITALLAVSVAADRR
jgi:hypothetical protein